MKIGLVGTYSKDLALVTKINKVLDDLNIDTLNMNEKNYDLANKVDLVLIA